MGDGVLHCSQPPGRTRCSRPLTSSKNPSSLNSDALKTPPTSVSSATETFVDDVKGLGAPDTESGEAGQELPPVARPTRSRPRRPTSSEPLDNVSGLTGLAAAVTSIGQSLTAMGTAFSSTLDTIDARTRGQELQTALQNSEACASLTS